MPLKGLVVIELLNVGPGPFCGQVLCDFGAQVIAVEKSFEQSLQSMQTLKRGKHFIRIDLKRSEGKAIFMKLCQTADVLIETFRPGVMERLGLGPEVLITNNEKLIYVRISGYGQTGQMAHKAGHDINYLSICGILSKLGPNDRPVPPLNIMADFGGGGLMAALGICLALIERNTSGKGQVIDANLTEGTAYLCSWVWLTMKDIKDIVWPNSQYRMSNLLDGGAPFYRCYKTSDDKYMSVGAVEEKFYDCFVRTLGLDVNDCLRYDVSKWYELSEKFETIFITKTQKQWIDVFMEVDACVTPVLDISTAHEYEHNMDRDSLLADGLPKPAPQLSRTSATAMNGESIALNTRQLLLKCGLCEDVINELIDRNDE